MRKTPKRRCTIDGCQCGVHAARGLCTNHYQQWLNDQKLARSGLLKVAQLPLFGPGTTETSTRRYRLHYSAIREAALERAGYVCERCAGNGSWRRGLLYAHHLTYDNLGAETLADVEVLCPSCHAREHRSRPELKRPPYNISTTYHNPARSANSPKGPR
jgi:5-methylcytosine-specific restriction endonuclease McrA